MKRLHKNMLTAGVFLAFGLGFGWYTLKEVVKTPEERHLDDANEKRLFHFGRADVVRGRLVTENATVAFERADDGGWRLTAPVRWPADDVAVDAALDRLATVRVDPVLTEAATKADLERAGLDRPEVEVHVELQDGRAHTLYVGTQNRLEEKYPVTTEARKRIGLAGDDFLWALDRPAGDLRDKHVFEVSSDEAKLIEVREADGKVRFRLEKDQDAWMISSDGKGPIPADAGEIRLLAVRVTKNLTVDAFLDDEAEPKPELDPPAFTLTVSSGPSKRRLVVGRKVGREATIQARIEDPDAGAQGTLVELGASILEAMDRSFDQLRDRTFTRFAPEDIHRIQLATTAKHQIVIVRSDGGWHLDGPDGPPAKVWKVDGILRAYSLLKATKIVKDDPTAAERREWLLDPPSRRLRFEDADGQVVADVRLGGLVDEDAVFLGVADDPRIGALSISKVEILPKLPSDLIDEEAKTP